MADTIADPLIQRAIPSPDPLCDFFWESGADGKLRILRCAECGLFLHPPSAPCPRCLNPEARAAPVTGRGVVIACTVNVQPWVAGQLPYSIAIVELDDQAGLRLTTNIVKYPPHDVAIGLRVTVCFVARHGLYYPVFRPDPGTGS